MIQGSLFDGPQTEPGQTPLARVAVELPVDGLYDYRIPGRFADRVRPGTRLWVSFSGRRVGAWCLERPETTEVQDPLEILGVAENQPGIPESLIALARWMARRYICPLGEVITALLPRGARAGTAGRRIRTAWLNRSVEETYILAEELLEKKGPQSRVLRILADAGGSLSVTDLRSRANVSLSPIRTLEKRGLIRTGYVEASLEAMDPEAEAYPRPERLSDEQEAALKPIHEAVKGEETAAFLLYGVTGSGKTEVYLHAIEEGLAQGRGAIVLVPEISLTPQTIARFKGRFPRVAVLHSRLTERERYAQWKRIRAGEADVVVGARSALFAPLPKVGLIVVDEEHETSFKQQNAPRYHARDVALERGRLEKATVILGSATPSLESYYMACTRTLRPLTLKHRVGGGRFPDIAVANLNLEKRSRGSFLSEALKTALAATLEKEEQAILFLNRRGYHTVLLCPACKESLKCARCDISLTLHRQANRLICHYCGHEQLPPETCPACEGQRLRYFGAGTERIEDEVRRLFPRARVLRMDSDTMVGRTAHEDALERFKTRRVDILIGTQMIAKGLDFPRVTLVGVISADAPLYQPDFRSTERAFQLLSQVSGRAGRGVAGGRVVVQTFDPEQSCIRLAMRNDYLTFARGELAARKAAGYPPFTHLIRALFTGEDEVALRATSFEAVRRLEGVMRSDQAAVLGPAQAPITQISGRFRWHLLMKSPLEEDLHRAAEALNRAQSDLVRGREHPIKMMLDRDPLSLL